MKILVVSPTPTHPVVAGNRARIKALLEQLAAMGHEVHFAHVERDDGDPSAMRSALGDRYHRVPYRRPVPDLWWRLRRSLSWRLRGGRWYSWRIDDWYDPAATAALAELHRNFHFEAVMVEYAFFSKAFEAFGPGVLKILDTHDVLADRHLQYLARGSRPQWYSTTRPEEARGIARADVVVAIQARERSHFEALGAKRVAVVGHLVELAERSRRSLPRVPAALFVASENPLNVAAFEAFAAEVWPLVRSRSQAELLVAGGICARLRPSIGLRLFGVLDDLGEAYRQADVVVNPVRAGTGLNIKNIEALGRGLPLVTTPAGSRGLEEGAGSAYLVADAPADFADAVARVLADEALAARLSEQATRFAERWNEAQGAELRRIFERP